MPGGELSINQSASAQPGVLLGALPIGDLLDLAIGSAAEDTAIGDAVAACGGMSFTPGTKVLLASGIAVPIASLKPGDKVLATNTRTGKTQAEPVTAVLVHHDTNRYDLLVRVAHATAVIHTTSTHLFWDSYLHQWITSNKLTKGEHLKTPTASSRSPTAAPPPRCTTAGCGTSLSEATTTSTLKPPLRRSWSTTAPNPRVYTRSQINGIRV